MLSFLYRLIRDFQREQGFPPNVVYLNTLHYRALHENLSAMTHEQAENFLKLNIVLKQESLHPHVAWHEPVHHRRAASGD